MDWRGVLSSEVEDMEKNEELLERLYSFSFKLTSLTKVAIAYRDNRLL